MLKKNQMFRLIAVHVISWCLVISMSAMDYLDDETYLWEEFLSENLSYIFLFYFNYFVLIPRFVYRKQYVSYVLASELTVLLLLLSLMTIGLFDIDPNEFDHPFIYVFFFIVVQIPVVLLFVVSFFARYFLDWYRLTTRQREMEIEKLNSQLRFLKMQVQPHFLFNSLNNLYALCIEKDDAAPVMVSKLSRLMRYMLYETHADKIELYKELEMMEDFVELQLLKKPVSERIDFYSEGIEKHHMIAPLLLLNFMENAFKHSDIFTDEEAFIEMNCEVTDDVLVFESVNSVGRQKAAKDISGIGNVNVKEQLEIIYPGKYTLEKEEKDDEYQVRLVIQLESLKLKNV